MQEPQQNPAQLEQQWLARLEAQNQLLNTSIKNSVPTTLDQISAWINYMHGRENYFRTYEPMALYLKGAGFPRLSERVEQVIAETQENTRVYIGMYQNTLTTQAQIQAIQQEANQKVFNIQQQTINQTRQATNSSVNQWLGVCPHCEYYLGNSYSAYKVCPKCGRLLQGGF